MMGYDRADYWQESFESAMAEEGLWHLVELMTPEQRANIGGALEASSECQSMAFPVPENPLRSENETLARKLRWERDLETCPDCRGAGRLIYNAGPWGVNSSCSKCSCSGKVHPRGEREPA